MVSNLKRALLVGIDTYDGYADLDGCVNDVVALVPLLSRNDDSDKTTNFHCHPLLSSKVRIHRRKLLESIDDLLAPGADVALFYFAGHGQGAKNDVILVSQDGSPADLGVSLAEVLGKVQASPVREVLIILDCCFSGGGGGVPQLGSDVAVLRRGVTLLSASRQDQPAAETASSRGLFSTYLCGALDGGAADVLGRVTMAGVYAYVSESFGPWDQRPTFKANVEALHELRLCSRPVTLDSLRRLPELFARADIELKLNPSFEHDRSFEPPALPQNSANEATFATLQSFRAAKLLEPVGADHLYYAAMQSMSCRLTPLGRHYWHLAKQGIP
jgi:uncharacterized caspase-like protein